MVSPCQCCIFSAEGNTAWRGFWEKDEIWIFDRQRALCAKSSLIWCPSLFYHGSRLSVSHGWINFYFSKLWQKFAEDRNLTFIQLTSLAKTAQWFKLLMQIPSSLCLSLKRIAHYIRVIQIISSQFIYPRVSCCRYYA